MCHILHIEFALIKDIEKEEATKAKETHLLQQVREDTNEPHSSTKNEDLFYFTYQHYPFFPSVFKKSRVPQKSRQYGLSLALTNEADCPSPGY